MPVSIALVLVLGVGSAYPQDKPSIDSVASGAVINQATMEPIDGAEVKFTPEVGIEYKTRTDTAGKFSFTKLPPGFYTIAVSRSGFVDPENSLGPRHIRVGPGDEIKDLRLQMTAASVISGRVTDENGQALSPAMVVALKVRYLNGRRVLLPGGREVFGVYLPIDTPEYYANAPQARTNENGEYRISGLSAGEYYLAIWHKGPENPTADLPPVYYPGVTDPAAAVTIKIVDNTPLPQMNIQVPQIEGHTARFKVALPDLTHFDCSVAPLGRTHNLFEIQHLTLIQRSANFDVLHFTNTDINIGNDNVAPARVQKIADDTWETSKLMPGAYELYYDTNCYLGAGIMIGKLSFNISDLDIDAGTLTVPMNASIQGQIRPPQGYPVRFDLLYLRLRPTDWSGFIMPTRTPKPTIEGTFKFQADRTEDIHFGLVVPGHYVFEVGGLPPDVYVSSIKFDGIEVRDIGFDIASGATGRIEVVLDSPGGTITGIIKDNRGEPVRESTVTLVPDNPTERSARLWKKVVTDQSGVFSVRGVVPGIYTVFAVSGQKEESFINPEFLETYQSQGTKVRVENRGTSNLELPVIRMGAGN